MPFTSPLIVRRVDATTWELVAPLSYQGRVDHWTIPSAFRSDFASVPWWVQWLIPRTGVWTLAAVLHDWLLVHGIPDGLVTSRQADGLFRRVLREEGTGFIRRWLMWAGVRLAAPFNPARRPSELWRDLPALTLIAAPFVALAFLLLT